MIRRVFLLLAWVLTMGITGCADIWGFHSVILESDATAPDSTSESSDAGEGGRQGDTSVSLDGDATLGEGDAPTVEASGDGAGQGEAGLACSLTPIEIGPLSVQYAGTSPGSSIGPVYGFSAGDADGQAESFLVRIQTDAVAGDSGLSGVSSIVLSTQCAGGPNLLNGNDGGATVKAAPGGLYAQVTLAPGMYFLSFTWDASVPAGVPYKFDVFATSPPAGGACAAPTTALVAGEPLLTGVVFDGVDTTPCTSSADGGSLPSAAYGWVLYPVTIPANTGWQITATPVQGRWDPWTVLLEAFSSCQNTACVQTVESSIGGMPATFALVNTGGAAASYVIGVAASGQDAVTGGENFTLSATTLPGCQEANNGACTPTGSDAGICCAMSCQATGPQNSCGALCSTACPTGEICSAGQCACPNETKKCGDACVATQTDPNNCGACGTICNPSADPHATSVSCMNGVCTSICNATYPTHCPAGTGLCTDTTDDSNNCGACGTKCTAPETCTDGKCGCPNAAAPNFCTNTCTNLQTDSNNCGACGKKCTAPEGCYGGACKCNPAAGTPDFCNGTCTDLQTDNDNCKTCGTKCTAPETCAGGVCGCHAANAPNFCTPECTNVETDVANCKSCGNKCTTTVTGASPSCDAGVCTPVCPSGESICTGACNDLENSNTHCGSCATACTGGQTCQGGRCTCPTGYTLCEGACVNIQSDNNNCGLCNNICKPDVTGGTAFCDGNGHCATTCDAGTLCAGVGCFNLGTSIDHCGACSTPCTGAPPTASTSCEDGGCVYTCPLATPTNCGASCANTKTDVNNCGGCGVVCSTGAIPACCNGACADLATTATCGSCTNACPTIAQGTTTCSGGTCTTACPSNQTVCGDTCTDTNSDNNNCLTCGNVCGAGTSCCNGSCVALSTIANCGSCGNACATGTPACCETNGALACTDTSSDPLNCGGCGAAGVQCGTAADGGPPSCVGGACQ